MKHPALTKVMSAALAVLCIVMIVFGAAKIGEAAETRDRGREAVENLGNKRENYIKLEEELMSSTVDYEAVTGEQAQRQEKYDRDNAKHRADLAEFSATKGGVEMGSLALDEAAYAIQVGRKQYEAGLKEFNEQLGDYAGLIEYLPTEEEMSGIKTTVDQAKKESEKWKAVLNELQGKLDAMREEGVSEITAGELKELVEALCEEKAVLELQEDEAEALLEASRANMELVNNILAELEADESIDPEELYDVLNSRVSELIGKSADEVRSELELDNQKIAEIRAAIAELNRRIEEADGQIEDITFTLDEVQHGIDEARGCYEEAAAKLEEASRMYDMVIMAANAKEMMKQAEDAMNYGQIEVNTAWYKLQQTKAGFAETEERLMTEKEKLAQDHIELSEVDRTVEEYDDLTARHKAARTALILYPEIKSRVEAGEDIAESAEAVRISMTENTEREYKGRMAIYILCISAGAFGLLTLPEAFEKAKTYPMLTVFAILCFLCAAAAEVLGMYLGWGQTYAALFGAMFALLLIAVGGKDKAAAA